MATGPQHGDRHSWRRNLYSSSKLLKLQKNRMDCSTMRLRYSRPFPPEPAMPAGLIELMEGLTREVLKHNPDNVYEFCTNHMQRLLEIRDGRAPKVPLTLEQKIKRAQEKVRKKSEERSRKYDEAKRLVAANATTVTSPDPGSDTAIENYDTSPIDQDTVNLNPVHDDLNEKEVEIAHESVTHEKEVEVAHVSVTQENPITSSEFVKKVVEPAKDTSSNTKNGAFSEPTVEESIDEHSHIEDMNIETEEKTEFARKTRSIDGTELETSQTRSSPEKILENKKSSFDEYIENESLPNEEDLYTSTVNDENEGNDDNSPQEANLHEIEISDDTKVQQTSDTAGENKEKESKIMTSQESEKKSVKEETSSQEVEKSGLISENSDGPKPEQFFLDDKSSGSVSAAHENKESKISDELNVKIDISNRKDNKVTIKTENNVEIGRGDTEKPTKPTAITPHVSVDKDQNMQDDTLVIHITTVGDPPSAPAEDGNKVTGSYTELSLSTGLKKSVLVNESINFGNVLDASEKSSNDSNENNLQANSNDLDGVANVEDEKIGNTNDTSEDQQIYRNIDDINNLTHVANNSTNSLYPNIKELLNTSDKIDDSVTEKLNNTEKDESDSKTNHLNKDLKNIFDSSNSIVGLKSEDMLEVENMAMSQNPEIKLETSGSIDIKRHFSVDNDNQSTKPEVSEPECQKKIVSTLSVPINTDLEERISHSEDTTPTKTIVTDSQESIVNNDGHVHVMSSNDESESQISEEESNSTGIKSNQDSLHEANEESGKGDPETLDMHFVEAPCNENNSPNRALHNKTAEESNIFSEKSEYSGIANDSVVVVDSSDTDSSSGVKTLDKTESESEEQSEQNNAIPNVMDLETAAVTIQKHFRNFMFKSKCSTFEDSLNDDHNSTDEDTDKDPFEYTGDLNINKERRTLGLIRMESVLQTVNEEKSLSLSTDESVSSAVTVIQAQVRGFLVRKRLRSKKTCTSQTNSEKSTSSDEQQKEKKTVLNIHIVPQGENFLSRDESMLESMDFSLDGSPPSSTNLHPLGYDKSEPRKQLKREDAVQSLSPPSNGKLSEDVEVLNENKDNIELQKKQTVEPMNFESIEQHKIISTEKEKYSDLSSANNQQKLKSIEQQKTESSENRKVEAIEKQTLEFIDSHKKEPGEQKIDSIEKQKTESIQQQKTNLIIQQKRDFTDQQTLEFIDSHKKEPDEQKIDSIEEQKTESIEKQNTNLTIQQRRDSTDQHKLESSEQQEKESAEKQELASIEQQKIESTDDLSITEPIQDVDADSCGTTSTRSTTVETVIEVHHDSKQDNTSREEIDHEDSEQISFDESDVITPLDDKSTDSESTSKLIHSGEFHDIVLPISPTQISRNTTVVREFKDVMGLFLLWK